MKALFAIVILVGFAPSPAFAEDSLNCTTSGILKNSFTINPNTVVDVRSGNAISDPNNPNSIDQINGIYLSVSTTKGMLTVFSNGNSQQDTAAIGLLGLRVGAGGLIVTCK